MASVEVGRVCVKTMGRMAGKFCVITRVIDESFVEITGPKALTGIKRKKSNIKHIEAIDKKVDIKDGANDESVESAIKAAGLDESMRTGLLF